jgi:DNA-binding NtrC family response regulator
MTESRSKAGSPPFDTKILVVDDDAGQRSLLESFLTHEGFPVITASSGPEALAILESMPVGMMISDVRMPGMTGLVTLRKAREISSTLPVVLVTAFPDVRDAVGAMQDGALNYLEKPIDLYELHSLVEKVLGVHAPSGPLSGELNLPSHVVANSPSIRQAFREAALVAPSETRVLITGESGVGKEVITDLIHAWSPRAKGPFIKVNCAAIPETLLESELFGHVKGAFTGANENRVGRFEEAAGGTLLLDEIAEMSPSLQAKLLRVTEDGTFQRVGSNQEKHSDARILAATNRDLESEVEEKRFREDLFFRLSVMEIYVPPLRERVADIAALASLFAAEFSDGKARLSPSTLSCLELYRWPGNVRELRNAMERAVLMAHGALILPDHLPKRVQKAGLDIEAETGEPSRGRRMEEVQRLAIFQAMREHHYNRTETARALGISRRTLLYKLKSFAEQGYVIGPEENHGETG